MERSMTLADSLGLTLSSATPGIQAKLSSELQQQFALKLNLTAEESKSDRITLQNNSEDHYRLYALWHKEHLITVTALDAGPFNLILADEALGPHWRARGSAEFVTEGGPYMTYTEVNRS